MKKYIYSALLVLIASSCKKENEQQKLPPVYLTNVKDFLKTNLADSDYLKLDFTNAVLSKQSTEWYLRIGFRDQRIDQAFVLLQTDTNGNCNTGKIIHISRDTTVPAVFNGHIISESFQHTQKQSTAIDNGVRLNEEAPVQDDPDGIEDIVPSCADCLPEVIVVGYPGSSGGGGGGISYGDYINLLELAGGNSSSGSTGSSSASGVYSPLLPTGSSPLKPTVIPSNDITVSYELSYNSPGINVASFLACFSTIPDPGSSCWVTIYVDLPVNDNPNYIFDATTGATGHCFLQLSKSNGSQSVTQYIGFTASSPVSLAGGSAPGKIVDNSGHKYNASLTMEITPAELLTEINAINAQGNNPVYNLLSYNCVNYAVGILNAIRSSTPLLPVFLQGVNTGEAYPMPQGLYLALEALKAQNGPDANNIITGVVLHVGKGHGASN